MRYFIKSGAFFFGRPTGGITTEGITIRLGLHNGGRALHLEQARGPSDVARTG